MLKNLIIMTGILLLTTSCSEYIAKSYYEGQGHMKDENICRARIADTGPGDYPECKAAAAHAAAEAKKAQ